MHRPVSASANNGHCQSSFNQLVSALLQERWHVQPESFAVLRLIDNTNFEGNCTGKSAGFAPLSMRST